MMIQRSTLIGFPVHRSNDTGYYILNIPDKVKNNCASDWFSGKSILISGGAGYLGTNLIHALEKVECNIFRLDRADAAFEPVCGPVNVRDLKGDVRHPSCWEKVIGDIDIVFHFAAQTSAYVANEDPPADLENNVVPILRLLEACRRNGVKKTVLFASTVTIVGLTSKLPVNEDFPDNPITAYDLHKLMAEQYLKYFTRSEIVSGTILRLSNVYGPGPRSSRPDRGILNQMTKRAVEGKALTVYGDGNYLRDYVHVEDVVTAFLNAAAHIDSLNGRHFVIGSGRGYTIKESMQLVADRVLLKTGHRVPIEHIKPPTPQSPIESRNFVADTSNFSGLTGWETSYDLVRGIDQMIERLL